MNRFELSIGGVQMCDEQVRMIVSRVARIFFIASSFISPRRNWKDEKMLRPQIFRENFIERIKVNKAEITDRNKSFTVQQCVTLNDAENGGENIGASH